MNDKQNIPPFGGQQQPKAQIPLSTVMDQSVSLTCSECQSTVFDVAYAFRKISAIISPSGEETVVPIQFFACKSCSSPMEELLPDGITKEMITGTT